MADDHPAQVVSLPSKRHRAIELYRLDALPSRPRRDEIVSGILAAGELVAVAGRGGVGKTALLARLAVDIAEGRPFLGRSVSQGSVVYVAAEKAEEVKRRLLAIRRRTSAPVYVTQARPNLADMGDVEALATAIEKICEIERRCPSLIVIDTLARSMPGLNEDRAIDTARVIDALTHLAERVPTAAVVVAHHVGKASNALRGSSALTAGLDLVLRVDRGVGPTGKIIVEKANAVDEGQKLSFRLVPVPYRETHDSEPETVISAEPLKASADHAVDAPVSLAILPEKSRRLLDMIQKEAPIRRVEALAKARADRLFEGSSDASRVAFNRCLDSLAQFVTVDDDGLIECRPATQ